jgi:hypothetical protein
MKPMKRSLLSIFFMMALYLSLFGQTGGEGVFNFLQLNNSAETAALGGIQVAMPDPDPEFILQNPSMLSPEMNNRLSVSYARYLAGIGFGYVAYARDMGKSGTAAIGIQFVDYGQFVAADETGTITGSFSASDYALTLSYAKKIGNLFTAGGSLKPVYSHLENYQSFGLVFDAGIFRKTSDQLTTMAICFRNVGTQLSTYYDGSQQEKIEWSLQAGFTRKLKYAPLRLCVTAYDLNRWGPVVADTDPNGIYTSTESQTYFSSAMRHLSVGAEIFPESIITFRFGYNYRRHADLTVQDQTGFTGFTTGLGIRLSAISFNYALSGYYQSGMVHNFSLTANLANFK